MSSLAGPLNTAAVGGIAGYGLYNQLSRAINGTEAKVHFIIGQTAVVEFDCTLSEQHSYQAQPTQFPVEDGSVVSDHIMTAPIQLQMVAAIADHPPESQQALVDAGVSAAVSAALSPLGGVSTLLGTVGFTSLATASAAKAARDQAKAGGLGKAAALSRSSALYGTLRRMMGYSQVDDGSDATRSQPILFDVVTTKLGKKWCRFSNMCITSMDTQRDSSTGARAVVFSLSLGEIRTTYADSVIVQVAQPEKLTAKKHKGEGGGEKEEESANAKRYRESGALKSSFDFLENAGTGDTSLSDSYAGIKAVK